MRIIKYAQSYEKKVIDLWNETLPMDAITVDKFRNQVLFDENFDEELCYLALEEESLVGFLLAIKRKFPYLERGLEPERGFISVMFVDPAMQKKGIGGALLEKAEADLRALGVKRITLGAYSPNYFFPGIDGENYPAAQSFFEAHGYVQGEVSFSMRKDLHGFRKTKEMVAREVELQRQGFSLKAFDHRYTLKLLTFARDEFGGGWKRNILISLRQGLAQENILLVTDPADDVVGFAMRMIDGNPMRFGPIGISEKVRNYGIGGILFDAMQWEMAKRGVYHLYFVTTDIPGRRFYERHGLEVFRTFHAYDKRWEE